MGRLSDVTLGDLVRGAGRYRPALIAVVVLLVGLQLLPARPGKLTPTGAPSDLASGGGPQVGSGATPTAASTSTTFGPTTTEPFASSSTSSFGSFSSSDTTVPSSDTGSSSSFTFSSSDTGTSATTTTAPVRPLSIEASAWATQTAGTPLASNGVPDGTLPVGKRVGQDDKRSFVRLSGTTAILALAEDSSGNRTPPSTATGPVGVRACQVTADWDPAQGETFAQAPAYDTSRCATGARSDDGSWRFDLTAFFTRTDKRGFALVPTTDAAVDYQVTFKTTALPG